MARIIQVIETHDRRGLGKAPDDPVRTVAQYFDFDGKLLWERDAWLETLEADRIDKIRTENKWQGRVIEGLLHVIKWALGEGDGFPKTPRKAPAFWWRTELRRRMIEVVPSTKETL